MSKGFFLLSVTFVALYLCFAASICVAGTPIDPNAPSEKMAIKINKKMALNYKKMQHLTTRQLKSRYATNYLETTNYQMKSADFREGFLENFYLTDDAETRLDEIGFVVIPFTGNVDNSNVWNAGPVDIYYQIFESDLPVFISADSILHAFHRSFDKLLETTEEDILIPAINDILHNAINHLDPQKQSHRDALWYFSVAKSLLDPEWLPLENMIERNDEASDDENGRGKEENDEGEKNEKNNDKNASLDFNVKVSAIKKAIASAQMETVVYWGREHEIDFGSFIPRGHYTHSYALSNYFKAMTWLAGENLLASSTDLRAHKREIEVARVLKEIMAKKQIKDQLAKMNSVYAAFVGRTIEPIKNTNGQKAIFSGIFPKRFGYTAWITRQTTTPKLKPAILGGRSMAMAEDVAFVLGSNVALDYLKDELALPLRQNLPSTLAAARKTISQIKPSNVDKSAYAYWLEGLMAAARPTVSKAYPKVMRTKEWHNHKLETVLASWTEMRHDTILLINGGYGGIGCVYPKGYVEPLPDLYGSLAKGISVLKTLFDQKNVLTGVKDEHQHVFKTTSLFFSHWQVVMEKLQRIAKNELKGKKMTKDELAFLNTTVDMHTDDYSRERMYNGWYANLFWNEHWSSEKDFINNTGSVSEPLVADVHTDIDSQQVLEMATGNPGLMVVAIDTPEGLALYGGPVSSVYSFHQPASRRLNDDQWKKLVDEKNLPPKPAYTGGYWVD